MMGPLYTPLHTTKFSGGWVSSNHVISEGSIPHGASVPSAKGVLQNQKRERERETKSRGNNIYTWQFSFRGPSEIRAVSPIFWGIWWWKNIKQSAGCQGFETMNVATTGRI